MGFNTPTDISNYSKISTSLVIMVIQGDFSDSGHFGSRVIGKKTDSSKRSYFAGNYYVGERLTKND